MRGSLALAFTALLVAAFPASAASDATAPIPPDKTVAAPAKTPATPDPSRFGPSDASLSDSLPSPITILKSRPINIGNPTGPDGGIDPTRFGMKPADEAYGAFQRGFYETAYKLALPRAEKGDAPAQALVAQLLSSGLGVRMNVAAAADWYQKAAAQGVPEAQFQVGLMKLDGKLMPKDIAGATDLMKKTADDGNPLAAFNLAQIFISQQPGETGLAKAAPYLEQAANVGLADAQYALSQLYANGTGGKPRDLAKARSLLQSAARQGYDTAELDYGTWLVDGTGGERDAAQGFAWLQRAATGGNVAAMNRVAKLYMQGIGVDPNTIDAAAWYMLAHKAGLSDDEMQDFLDGLTDQQIAQATQRSQVLR